MNDYLAYLARGNVLVLDTSALGTSRAMAKTIGKKYVTAFGVDKRLEKKCKTFGIKCVPGWSGDVLKKLGTQKFDIIYLDYCGTPDGNASFNPIEDMDRASTMLTRGGILACTFCKRCSNIASKCLNMAPHPLSLRRAFEYCDTAAMIFVVYSTRKLPMVGPPVGSIVQVEKWFGRVDQVYLNGVALTCMKRINQRWVEDESDTDDWDETFDKIKVIQMPRRKRLKKKRRKRCKMDLADLLAQVVSSVPNVPTCLANNKHNEKPVDKELLTLRRNTLHKWFDECIDANDQTSKHPQSGRYWLQKKSAFQHYKSWCNAKGVPAEHRLSDRCSKTCKQNKCHLDSCPRFLVHMCDALGYERYVKEGGVQKREAFKAGQGKEAKLCYKAYFKKGKSKDVTTFDGSTITLVQAANYKTCEY